MLIVNMNSSHSEDSDQPTSSRSEDIDPKLLDFART